MTKYLRYGVLTLAAFLLVAGVHSAVAQDAAQKTGAELYEKNCMSCHTPTPAKMMGKPVDGLVASMEKVKNMSSASGPLLKMQDTLKALSPEQIKAIATYVNQLKP
ncbi:MAG: cytochrome c [Desulfovibrio sp.]|nr:cytochrome c [Desulfovibrio sp.]